MYNLLSASISKSLTHDADDLEVPPRYIAQYVRVTVTRHFVRILLIVLKTKCISHLDKKAKNERCPI